jgi:hypothetical protein
VTDDGVADRVEGGGDAVSDVEHAATRKTAQKTKRAFIMAPGAGVMIRELNTRLVKTKSSSFATLTRNADRMTPG